jgi:hypothetical protein
MPPEGEKSTLASYADVLVHSDVMVILMAQEEAMQASVSSVLFCVADHHHHRLHA